MKANEKSREKSQAVVLKDSKASKKAASKKTSTVATASKKVATVAAASTASEDIIIYSSSLIDGKNLTYRQLKELVPATQRSNMPSEASLKGKKIISAEVKGGKIVVYQSGYLAYTELDGYGIPRTTVYSVHCCDRIVYKSLCSANEYKEECASYGAHCKLAFGRYLGQFVRYAIVSEEAYLDGPWWFPIVSICDIRLRRNADYRERSNKVSFERIRDKVDRADRNANSEDDVDENFGDEIFSEGIESGKMSKGSAMSEMFEVEECEYVEGSEGSEGLDDIGSIEDIEATDISDEFDAAEWTDDSEDWTADCPDSEAWLEPDIRTVRQAKDHKRLTESLKKLKQQHRNQHTVIKLYFKRGEMSEREIAKKIGGTHQNVHKTIQAGLKNLRKNFVK